MSRDLRGQDDGTSPWFDTVLGLAFVVLCGAETAPGLLTDTTTPRELDVAWGLVLGLGLALSVRRRAPLASVTCVMLGLLGVVSGPAALAHASSPQLLLFVAPYSVACHSDRRRALLGLLVSLVAMVAIVLRTESALGSVVFAWTAVIASWWVGRAVRSQRLLAAELEETSRRLVDDRGRREREVVSEQRWRIAHELQALTAEQLTTMVIQTRTATVLLEQGDPGADAAMERIELLGRQSLVELRRTLGALRASSGTPVPFDPARVVQA